MNTRPLSRAITLAMVCSAFSTLVKADSPVCKMNTLNEPPPKRAIVLFDGTDLSAWLSQKNRKWEDSDGPADWKICNDESMEVVPGAGSLITKKHFGDFRLHLEYRLLEPPTNGGVFIMCRYELGIKQGEDGDRQYGVAFENLQEPIQPIVRATRPTRQWQTLDVEFRAPRLDSGGAALENARATVWLNGQLIHDNVELGPRKGAAKRLGDATVAPLMLQEHGDAYQFRNIWIIDRSQATRHALAN
jgi:hypothetical protein